MTNSEIADYITDKYARIEAMRQARKEEWEAVIAKAKSAVDNEYQTALDRRVKV
jgi:hypothetical protein